MKLYKLIVIYFIVTIFVSCESGYIVTNDNRVLTGRINFMLYPGDDISAINYKLSIKTEIKGKKRRYRFNVKEIKCVKAKWRNTLQISPYFIQDSATYKPLNINGITFLCQLLKSKNNVSIFYLTWSVDIGVGYGTGEVGEFILVSNGKVIEINPYNCFRTRPNGKTYYYPCRRRSCQNQNKVSPDTTYGNGKEHKRHRDNDDSGGRNNDILCFINNRYQQQFEMKDFKSDEKGMSFREKQLNTTKTTEKMLNYILDKETELEQKGN